MSSSAAIIRQIETLGYAVSIHRIALNGDNKLCRRLSRPKCRSDADNLLAKAAGSVSVNWHSKALDHATHNAPVLATVGGGLRLGDGIVCRWRHPAHRLVSLGR
jgi:hypothetical protein